MIQDNNFNKRHEKLPVFIYDDQHQASINLVNTILATLTQKESRGEKLVLGLSTRSATIPVYELFAKAHREGRSFKNVVVFGINEFYPLNRNQLQSHYRFLKEYIFDVLDIPENQIHFLDGEVSRSHVVEHCQDYEKKIAAYGGIDILITSGMGSNEPSSP